MDNMARYSRKFRAHGADGIGIWTSMMTFLTYICIPVNIGIIFYTGHQVKDGNGKTTPLGVSTEASFRKFLFASNWQIWTPLAVLWLAIFVEHILFVVKYGIALAIGDVPQEVVDAENRRPMIFHSALRRLEDIKEITGVDTYED